MRSECLKVLIVVEATAAGVGRHVSDLTTNLDTDRFDLTVAWSPIRSDERFRDTIKHLEARGVRTHAIPMSRGISFGTDLTALASLIRLIARERFDVVHVHSSKAGFLGRIAARVARPSAVTMYSPNAISISLNRAYWYPEKAAGWLTDALVAVSASEREELSGYGLVPGEKLVQVTAGIPLPDENPELAKAFREELGIPADAILVGTVGRVSYQKDPATFLDAAEQTLRANPAVHFVWVGPGEDLEVMRAEAVRRQLADRVRFTGYRKDAQQLLEAMDVFLLTSRYESFGYVTCEAMAFGKAVVASRVNGSRELVEDGMTGFLVPAGDAPGFAQALQVLLDDPAVRENFGAAGKKRVEQFFSLGRMVSEIEQLYLSLAARKQVARTASPLGRSAEAK